MSIGLSVVRVCLGLSLCLGMHLAPLASVHADIVMVDFEEFDLGSDGYLNRTPGTDPTGVEQAGLFISDQGVGFSNSYSYFSDSKYEFWSGFAISDHTDALTPGVLNQYSAILGSGADNSLNYAVAYVNNWGVDTSVADDLRRLPSIQLPQNLQANSMMVTNTTYAFMAIKKGDDGNNPAWARKFGDTDYLKLTVFGIDSNNQVLSVDFMLADYLSRDSFILEDWASLDLTPLANAQSLHFNLESSDPFTPTYFAMDNLTLSAVPEPSGLLLLTCMGLGLAFRRSRSSG